MRSIATIFAFLLLVFGPMAVQAQTFTVNSTSDDSRMAAGVDCTDTTAECTLRAAIEESSDASGPVTIEFDIDEALEDGAYRIRPVTRLPTIGAGSVTIDGTTQPGYEADNKLVVLDGSLCTSNPCSGLRITSNNNTVRGLTIHGFAFLANDNVNPTAAVRVRGSDNIIEHNYIGIEFDGSAEGITGNRRGIRITGDNNFVRRNVISNNVRHGISLRALEDDATGTVTQIANENTIQRNWIGTDPQGGGGIAEGADPSLSPYGNGRSGIRARGGAFNNVVTNNTIAFNGYGLEIDDDASDNWPGVLVRGNQEEQQTISNQIRRNRTFSNSGLGIDIVLDEEVANRGTSAPQDEEGPQYPNHFQNFPEILETSWDEEANEVWIRYNVPSVSRARYPLEIEFFRAESPDPGAEGDRFIGDDVFTQSNFEEGESEVTFHPDWQVSGDDFVVATATNSEGSTSEYSSEPFVIPVEFADTPAATYNDGAVVLSWATLSETNNAGFQVQQRVNGSFENVEDAFVEGQGTSTSLQNYEYTLEGLSAGTHTLRLEQQDFDGTVDYSAEFSVTVPAQLELTEAAPNPFSGRTTVTLTVDESQQVTAEVYDVLGRRVTTLHDGEVSTAQPLELTFDANGLSSGLYLIRVEGETFSEVRRATLVR